MWSVSRSKNEFFIAKEVAKRVCWAEDYYSDSNDVRMFDGHSLSGRLLLVSLLEYMKDLMWWIIYDFDSGLVSQWDLYRHCCWHIKDLKWWIIYDFEFGLFLKWNIHRNCFWHMKYLMWWIIYDFDVALVLQWDLYEHFRLHRCWGLCWFLLVLPRVQKGVLLY